MATFIIQFHFFFHFPFCLSVFLSSERNRADKIPNPELTQVEHNNNNNNNNNNISSSDNQMEWEKWEKNWNMK